MKTKLAMMGTGLFGAVIVTAPAYAGMVPPVPGPVAGIGLGAVVALGVGYRYLRGRIEK